MAADKYLFSLCFLLATFLGHTQAQGKGEEVYKF